MKFATAVKYDRFTPLAAQCAALYLALFFVIAAVSQLFAFEDFPHLIADYGLLFFSDEWSLILAALIVVLEISAIPYLLSMKQSQLAHVLSFSAGWIVLAFWFTVTTLQSLSTDPVANTGLFGTKIVVPPGWWLVIYMIALVVLSAFVDASSYQKRHARKKHKRE